MQRARLIGALMMLTMVACLSAQQISLVTEFQHIPFGVGIGATGLMASDLDQDGRDEIIAGASWGTVFGANNFWYVLKRRGTGMEMVYVSPLYAASITCVRVADISGDGRDEIVIASGNTLYAYDGCDFHEVRRTITSASGIRALNIIDVDSDGVLEYVFTSDSALYIYNVATGALEYQSATYRGADVAVGNVDTDDDLEIVVATGDTSTGYVLNGRTRAVEWAHPNGFGSMARIGDVNSQFAGNEIVGARIWGAITVYNAAVRSPLYEQPSFNNAAIKLADVNRDGRLEIVHGDAQWGAIWVRDGETLALLGSINNPEHGVTDIAIADTDGDSTNEVLWGAGYSSTGPDYLFIGDLETYQIVWQSQDIVPPFYAIAYGDLDNDGIAELVYGSVESDSGYAGGTWFVRNSATWELLYASPPDQAAFTPLMRLAVANVDDDPQAEIFVGSSSGYTGYIVCYDSQTHQRQYQTAGLDGLSIWGIQVADLNRDGTPELIVSTRREHTGAQGTYVYIYNARTGAYIWRSVNLGLNQWNPLAYLRVGNIDTDDALEIVVAEETGQIVIYDGVTRLQQLATPAREVTALELADLNADGIQEILVGTANGALYLLNPSTGGILQGLGNYGGRIDGLQVADVLGTPDPDLIFCVNSQLHVRYIDATTNQTLIWRSPSLGQDACRSDSLRVADLNRDGRPEIIANVGFGLRVFHLVTETPNGDINRDGCVDDADLLILLCEFGASGSNLPADINRDGRVDDSDLLQLLFQFGSGC
ncbi:hypothetical protein HRbin15_02285 [bacterium HR15]|nr:hypothetical protein HRbin15_02285 [bacterium HR15]